MQVSRGMTCIFPRVACIMCSTHTHTPRTHTHTHAQLATSLSFRELTRLGRLNRGCLRLHDAAWRASWRSKTCDSAELAFFGSQ